MRYVEYDNNRGLAFPFVKHQGVKMLRNVIPPHLFLCLFQKVDETHHNTSLLY